MKNGKIFGLVLAVVLILSVLSACGTKENIDDLQANDFTTNEWTTKPGSNKYAGRTLRILQTAGGGGNYYEPVVESKSDYTI